MKTGFKKAIIITTCLIMFFGVIGIGMLTVSANNPTSGTCGDNVTWEYDESTLTLTISGAGAMKDYSRNKWDYVTTAPWEPYCSFMKTVIINNGVTSIGMFAFSECTLLSSITIPDSVTIIDGWAFYRCSGLTSITIPESVTKIGYESFRYCTGLTSITIPDSVTDIGNYAFNGCNGLININVSSGNTVYHSEGNCLIKTESKTLIAGCKNSIIPDDGSVTGICDWAFAGYTSLTSITIPDSVTWIGEYAFNGVPNIYYNGTASGSLWGAEVLNGYVDGYLVFIDSSKTDLRVCSTAAVGNITIPDSVTSIGAFAFSGCTGLTSITIPDSVTSINDSAFSGCPLEYVKMGSGLTSIPSTLIQKDNLKTFIIGNGVTRIGSQVFFGCTELTSITIPDSVTNIGDDAFNGCARLTSVTIPAYVTIIGNGTFAGCTELTSITLPDSITSIGDSAFKNCTALSSVTIGNSVKSIGGSAFSGCTGLTSITIPDGVTNIGGSAFNDCSGLKSLIFNASICADFSLYYNPFSGCSSLNTVTIGNSVTKIPAYFLYECQGITSITISDSVTSIGEYAFYNCPLEYVKMGSGLTSISSTLIQFHKDSLKTFIIGNGVTSINDSAFKDCTALSSVTIGNSVKSIGGSAFFGCTGLTSITIPDSVTSIGSSAFLNCSGLTSINIGTGVKTINDSAFSGCTSLATLTLPAGITKIGVNAFNNTAYYNNASNWIDYMLYIGNYLIKGKTDLAGNKSVKSGTTCIADSALSGCNKIITLTVPDSVNYIGSNAFGNVTNVAYTGTATGSPWGARCLNGYADGNFVYSDSGKAKLVACSGLATGSVVIPASTDTIGDNAFSTCSGITSVYIPVNVTRIGVGAFQGTALSDVYYEGGATEKLVLSIADNNTKVNNATWHYNSKVTDMPSNSSNPDNPDNPTNPDNPNPPTPDIPEVNVIRGNSDDNKKTYNYRTTVTFTANVPEGGSVQWYVDGSTAGNGSTLTVKDKTNDYTVKVVVTDKNGNKTMDEEQVTIKHGFFDILIWFFVHLFNPGAYDVKQ